MKILRRDKEKKEKTPEEEELETYKKVRNLGLISAGTGVASFLGSRFINQNKLPSARDNPSMQVDPKSAKLLEYAGIGLGVIGLGSHGIGAIKYNKLKKKLKEEKKDDNNSEKKD